MSEPFVVKPEDIEPFDVPHHENTEARELINPARGSDEVVFRLTRMGPGGQDHWHDHDGSEQLIFVRSGEGQIRISQPNEEDNQDTYPLEPESFVYLPRNAYHQVQNTGGSSLELIVMWIPPYDSLEEWDPANN